MIQNSTQSGDLEEARGVFLLVVPWALHYAGGVNQVVLNLSGELKRHGAFKPLVLVLNWSDVRPRHVVESGLDTVYFRPLPWPVFRDRRFRGVLGYALWAPRFVARFMRLIRSHRINVINVHYPNASAFGFILLKRLGLFRGRVILSFHGTDIRQSKTDDMAARAFLLSMLSAADAVVACSKSLASEISQCFPTWTGKVEVIENGVDPQRLRDEVDTLEPLPSGLVGRTFLLTVGAFVWDKGHDVLLEAFRRVASMHPNLLLVMIGRSGPALATLRSTIRELRLDDRVIMLADMPHKDLLRYYRRASLFVLPSRREAFGIVLLEAGVFALPVVATKVGGVPEALGNDECGFLVPPEDPEAMSQAILSLLGDPERAARAGRRLFTRVTTQFSWTSSCARYLQLAQI